MKKIISSKLVLLLSLIALGWTPISVAQEFKPVLTVSCAGYSELMADVDMFGKLSGKPNLAKDLEGLLAAMTQGQGLSGLDKKQPLGIVALTDGSQNFTYYGFVPVIKLDQLMGLIKDPQTGEGLKAENGVYRLPRGRAYITQRGKWAFIVDNTKTFDAVASDPKSLLGDLPKKYLLAARASVKNIPDAVLQQGFASLDMMMQMAAQRQPGESDEQLAARTEMLQQNLEQIKNFATEMDEALLGLNIDRTAKKAVLDLDLTAKPDTDLAAQIAKCKPGKSAFTALKIPGAAVTYNAIDNLTDDDVERLKKSLDYVRLSVQETLKKPEIIQQLNLTEEQFNLAGEVLEELCDVATKSIETKRTDLGAALILKPNAMTFIAGGVVAEGKELEKAVMKIIEQVQKDQPLKMTTESYKDFSLQTLSLPIPETEKEWIPVLGKTLDVVLGASDKKVFLAAGRDALKTMKQVIDKSATEAEKEIPAMQIVVSAAKIARFAADFNKDQQNEQLKAMAATLEKSGAKDHITLTYQSIPNGIRIHLEVEEGMLKALGTLLPASLIPGM